MAHMLKSIEINVEIVYYKTCNMRIYKKTVLNLIFFNFIFCLISVSNNLTSKLHFC